MSGIKEIIKNYIDIDDQIKVLNKQMAPLKQAKTSLGLQIEEFLCSNADKPNSILEVGNDIFKVVKVNKKQISKDRIEDVIKSSVDEKVASSIMEELTETKESSFLRRTTKK
jgi:hypothetical protein